MKTIAVVCTLDTKGAQAQFVIRLIEQRGHRALLVDTGVLGTPPFSASVSRDDVAQEAGTSIQALANLGDRGKALAAMMAGATTLVAKMYREGKIDGVLGMGGGSGTSIASAVMRGLPFGVPKVMISTMAGGEVGRYVGTKDIAMLNSVTDIMGLNPLLRRILANGVGAIVGMVETADLAMSPRENRRKGRSPSPHSASRRVRPCVAMRF